MICSLKEEKALKSSKWYGGVKRIICGFSATALILSCAPFALAENEANKPANSVVQISAESKSDNAELNYRKIKKSYSFKEFSGDDIKLSAAASVLGEAEIIDNAPDYGESAVKLSQGEDVEFSLDTAEIQTIDEFIHSLKMKKT